MKAHATTLLVMQNATGLTAMAIIRIRLPSARKLSAAVKHITTCSHIAFVICGKGLRNLSMKCRRTTTVLLEQASAVTATVFQSKLNMTAIGVLGAAAPATTVNKTMSIQV